jgi:hypothetical protein
LRELGSPERFDFDVCYLKLCGFNDPEQTALRIERELRSLASERSERRLSVADAKVTRRRATNVAASIDAYATKLASSMRGHPDPRDFVEGADDLETVVVTGAVQGALEVGVELFNQGEVIANGESIAQAGSVNGANFVKAVLLLSPEIDRVGVPKGDRLEAVIAEWRRERDRWRQEFRKVAERTLVGIDDQRTRDAIIERALRLLHAF